MKKFFGLDKIRIEQCFCSNSIPAFIAWTKIKIWSVVRRQFRIEQRSTLELLWCNANYGWTRIKFKFDPSSKLNDVNATLP